MRLFTAYAALALTAKSAPALAEPGLYAWHQLNASMGQFEGRHIVPSNCVHFPGWVCHGTPVFRTAFAIVTSLRAIATMIGLWGLPRILRAFATDFRTGF